MPMLMDAWNTFAQSFRRPGVFYKRPFLAPEQVDTPYDARPFVAGNVYGRLWLVEMHLARGVAWFQQRYPVVYTSARYDYGGKVVTVPYIAGPDSFKDLTQSHLERSITLNSPLTPLFPFNRGDLAIQAGLMSLAGDAPLKKFIATVSRLSAMLPIPEFSTVVHFAEPIYNCVQDLFDAGAKTFELGYQETFTAAGGGGANDLRPGYFATILAPQGAFDDGELRIVDGSLRRAAGPGGAAKPLAEYSYMLFRIEKRDPEAAENPSSQDWEALTKINEKYLRARDAIISRQTNPDPQQLVTDIELEVYRSSDIVKADRPRVVAKIRQELRDLGLQGSTGKAERRSLHAVMQRPTPALDDATRRELDALDRFFAARPGDAL